MRKFLSVVFEPVSTMLIVVGYMVAHAFGLKWWQTVVVGLLFMLSGCAMTDPGKP